MNEILRALYSTPPTLPAPTEADGAGSLASWWDGHRARSARFSAPIDRAIFGGYCADRLGYAFAGGYHAALSKLIPSLDVDRFAALCATEEAGAHPRAIKTSLAPSADAGGKLVLNGKKRWATMATRADALFIVASIGEDNEGKNRLRLVRVRADQPGVRVIAMPDAPFAPEIPHASVELAGVLVDPADVLDGDGYDLYLKAFRTIEDAHVHGALLGYLLGVARRGGWPTAIMERITAELVCARALAEAPASAPEVHIALAGMLAETKLIIDETRDLWTSLGAGERARWERDKSLLEVAGKARAARTKRAWETLV